MPTKSNYHLYYSFCTGGGSEICEPAEESRRAAAAALALDVRGEEIADCRRGRRLELYRGGG